MRLVSALFAVAIVGCSAAEETEVEDLDEGALETRSVTIELRQATGGMKVFDAPRLKSGARSDLSCQAAYEGRAGLRYACSRGSERLEILHRKDAENATLLYKNGAAKRLYFACTADGERLQCTTKSPSSSGGGLSSPLASTVDGISIPNAHAIDGAPLLLRGMAPRSPAQFDELDQAGVKAVLIFKNATGQGHDVEDELAELDRRGFGDARVKHVPFRWKDIPSFKDACEQTVDALKFLETQKRAGKKTFFHCTVGEDRTGYLAALSRLLRAPSTDPRELFQGEMCERGYGSGNPLKPFAVTGSLERELTPLFRKMAYLVKTGALSSSNLDASVCENDPQTESDFGADDTLAATNYRCGTSTAFEVR